MKYLLVLLLFALPLQAAEVSFDFGPDVGVFVPKRELPLSYISYSYLDRLNKIGYYEWTIGAYQAQAGTQILEAPFVASALGWTTNHGQGFFLQSSFGLSLLTPSERLATQLNFQLSLFSGYRLKYTTVRCGLRHYSNGSNFINSPEPNIGEEFLLCGFGFRY